MTSFYQFLLDGYGSWSLETFKLTTLLFPGSANEYDNYAYALDAAGKKEEVIIMYGKSILLNPKNESGKNKLKKLLEEGK